MTDFAAAMHITELELIDSRAITDLVRDWAAQTARITGAGGRGPSRDGGPEYAVSVDDILIGHVQEQDGGGWRAYTYDDIDCAAEGGRDLDTEYPDRHHAAAALGREDTGATAYLVAAHDGRLTSADREIAEVVIEHVEAHRLARLAQIRTDQADQAIAAIERRYAAPTR